MRIPSSARQVYRPGHDRRPLLLAFLGAVLAQIAVGQSFTEFTLPTAGGPATIASGPDGKLWFTEPTGAGNIARITTAGVINKFVLPTAGLALLGAGAAPIRRR